jgi:hypothetical protein
MISVYFLGTKERKLLLDNVTKLLETELEKTKILFS